MDEVAEIASPVTFKAYGRALEWGFPMGVGYRYLSMPQSVLLLRLAAMPAEAKHSFLRSVLETES
jgi:hypothetical protein